MGRAARFGAAAAGMAVRDAGLCLLDENPERIGVVMGTGMIPIDLPEVAAVLAKACDESRQSASARTRHRPSRVHQRAVPPGCSPSTCRT